MADGQNALLKGSNCLGSHLIPAHFGRREFNNIIRRSLCDVLQRFLSEKSLMSRNHERSGEIHHSRSQFLCEPLQTLISVRPLMAHHLHVHRYR